MIYKMFFLIVVFSANCCFCQQKNYQFFSGKWINIQYEYILKNKSYKDAGATITPKFLLIDSFGRCTIFSNFEQKSSAGMPIRERSFGKAIKQLTYKHWGEMYLTQILNSDSLIVITAKNNGMSIVFRKVY